jgi:hypothetical protein
MNLADYMFIILGNNDLSQNFVTVTFNVSCIFKIFIYLQCFASVLAVSILFCYPSLVTTLIAVACSQFDKLKAAILDIRQQHITSRHWQEDEQDHTISSRKLQAKLSACIRHHQNIIE